MSKIVWNVFDPDMEYRESFRALPHRDQTGALTCVTFRLADSMPAEVVLRWQAKLEHWLQEKGLGTKDVQALLEDPNAPTSLCDVERFVVMPNHVHVLIQMRQGFDLRKQFRENQRYSARQINIQLNRTGTLWQGEPFDHIVRTEAQFVYLQQYILSNPAKAGLKEGGFLFWSIDTGGSVVPIEN